MGTSCSVAGWGAVYYVCLFSNYFKNKQLHETKTLSMQNGPSPDNLLRINATVIDRTVCNGRDSYGGAVKEGMLCAGDMAGGTDACK